MTCSPLLDTFESFKMAQKVVGPVYRDAYKETGNLKKCLELKLGYLQGQFRDRKCLYVKHIF